MAARVKPQEPQDASAVSWLTGEERQVWLRLLAVTIRLPGALDAHLQRDAGLTLFEYTVLAALSEQESLTLGMSDLAMLAQGSQSRLSHTATKLERYGLIVRRPHPSNGRAIDAVLTDTGLARLRAAAPQHVATVRRLVFDGLPADRAAVLADTAEAILARIDPDPAARPWDRF